MDTSNLFDASTILSSNIQFLDKMMKKFKEEVKTKLEQGDYATVNTLICQADLLNGLNLLQVQAMYTDCLLEVDDHALKLKDQIMDTLLDAESIEDITIVAHGQIEQLRHMAWAIPRIARLGKFVQDSNIRYKKKHTEFTIEKCSIAILKEKIKEIENTLKDKEAALKQRQNEKESQLSQIERMYNYHTHALQNQNLNTDDRKIQIQIYENLYNEKVDSVEKKAEEIEDRLNNETINLKCKLFGFKQNLDIETKKVDKETKKVDTNFSYFD